MSNADEIRWRQRLANFSNALAQLSAACHQPDYTDLERSGLVQT
ncbi:MAG: nucleotidyltransferase, partial [Candidatus Synechococcus spongiarum 142]